MSKIAFFLVGLFVLVGIQWLVIWRCWRRIDQPWVEVVLVVPRTAIFYTIGWLL